MEKTKAEKSAIIKKVLFAIAIIGTITAFVFESQIFGEASVFNKAVSANGVVNTLYNKIPALIRSIQIITIAFAVALIFRAVMHKSFAKSKRGVTIIKLLESFLKWIIAVIAVLLVLGAWGVDTGTLLAGAGILTLVVGLGAQSLVSDIVAGVFMVFEGEFQVGDIVIINGWRGTVQEIGIRTTKIVDTGGNVNIVNNSEITTVINQTQEYSVAKCVIGIEYGESIPRVEIAVRDNLDKIKENIPAIIEGPFYKGVTELGASSVNLLFVAKCKEEDIFQVQRDMNRELKLLFDEYDINIPFPQVVLNQPVEFEKKTTGKMKAGAKEFIKDQIKQSRGLEEKDD